MTDAATRGARLEPGQALPALTLQRTGGGAISLPHDLAGRFGVVLVYRGAWCPYCNAQLASFQRAADKLAATDISVVALSVDDEQTTQSVVDKHHLEFPVAYGADADAVSSAWGAYTNDDPHFLQSTGFVLAPDGTLVTAVYSSGAIGRLVVDDVLGLVQYAKQH